MGRWLHLDRSREEAPKKKPPEFRAAPVAAKGELVEIRLAAIGLHGTRVGSERPALEEVGDAANPRQSMGRFAGTGHDPGLRQIVVSDGGRARGRAIGDDGTRLHAVRQERA